MLLARSEARTRTEAQVTASRLPSFHYQTRTRTVIGRPYRGANSVSLVPARIALQGGVTREHRCDRRLTVFPSLGLAMCPCPSQEESSSGLWPPNYRGPRVKTSKPCCWNLTVTRFPQHTRNGTFLRKLLKITRFMGRVNFSSVNISLEATETVATRSSRNPTGPPIAN